MQFKTIIIWVLRIGMAGLFALSATQKLINDPQYISEFAKIGLGDWLRYATAAFEIGGLAAVLNPRTTPYGAIMLLLVTLAAFVAQVTVLHVGWLHCVAIAAALIALIILTKSESKQRVAT